MCAFAVLLAAFAFSACNKDDEEDSYDISTLEGNWINDEAEEMVVFSNGHMYTRMMRGGLHTMPRTKQYCGGKTRTTPSLTICM